MLIKKAESIQEVKDAFSEKKTVLYQTKKTDKDKNAVTFILNPFGGGVCATEELQLSWQEIDDEKLNRTYIITL